MSLQKTRSATIETRAHISPRRTAALVGGDMLGDSDGGMGDGSADEELGALDEEVVGSSDETMELGTVDEEVVGSVDELGVPDGAVVGA